MISPARSGPSAFIRTAITWSANPCGAPAAVRFAFGVDMVFFTAAPGVSRALAVAFDALPAEAGLRAVPPCAALVLVRLPWLGEQLPRDCLPSPSRPRFSARTLAAVGCGLTGARRPGGAQCTDAGAPCR